MSEFHFSMTVQVRFADCDMMGHVNHTKILTYCEEVRVKYLQAIEVHFDPESVQKAPSAILVDVHCSYKNPAFYSQSLKVYTRVSEIRNSSFTMEYEILEEKSKQVVAQATTVIVAYDYRQKKSIQIPDEWRKKIEVIEQRSFSKK